LAALICAMSSCRLSWASVMALSAWRSLFSSASRNLMRSEMGVDSWVGTDCVGNGGR
jgi:hypothetical protein